MVLRMVIGRLRGILVWALSILFLRLNLFVNLFFDSFCRGVCG